MDQRISLTRLVKDRVVRQQLDRLLNLKVPGEVRHPLYAENPQLVGTAYDYLVRFEVERRNRFAVTGPWLADYAEEAFEEIVCWYRERRNMICFSKPSETDDEQAIKLAEYVLKHSESLLRQVRRIGKRGRSLFREHRRSQAEASEVRLRRLAQVGLQLAYLDNFYRSRMWPQSGSLEPKACDVEEVVALFQETRWEQLLGSVQYLNVDVSTERINGDIDLISDDRLIDLKACKNSGFAKAHRVQLLGYMILCREKRRRDPTFPEIRHLGIYFARHAELKLHSVEAIDVVPSFSEWFRKEFEPWFLHRAPEEAWKRFSNPNHPTSLVDLH